MHDSTPWPQPFQYRVNDIIEWVIAEPRFHVTGYQHDPSQLCLILEADSFDVLQVPTNSPSDDTCHPSMSPLEYGFLTQRRPSAP